jgi:hypothetical protein
VDGFATFVAFAVALVALAAGFAAPVALVGFVALVAVAFVGLDVFVAFLAGAFLAGAFLVVAVVTVAAFFGFGGGAEDRRPDARAGVLVAWLALRAELARGIDLLSASAKGCRIVGRHPSI